MIDDRARRVIDLICRDFEAILEPELTSPRARFLAGATKSLLQMVRQSTAPAEEEAPAGDLASTLAATLARLPDTGGAREAAYQQSGSGLKTDAAAEQGALSPIDAPMLLAYLKEKPGYEWVAEVTVSQTSGGFSKETYLASVTGGDRLEDLVLRRDPPFSPLHSTVIGEYPLLSALGGHALPIPTVLWLEGGEAAFGAPVMAMARLSGSADVAHWSQDPATARTIIDDTARLLARLHEPDLIEAFGQSKAIPGSNGDTPAAMVADLRAFWRGLGIRDPLVESLFDWLEAHAPAAFTRRALIHGDFGFHNLLVENGRLTGLLDWEFAHVGDIAEDLAYARPFIEQVLPWEEFEALYHGHGGSAADPSAVHFWGVFGIFRIGLACHATIAQLDAGNPRLDAKAIYVGLSFATPFVVDAAKLALKAG